MPTDSLATTVQLAETCGHPARLRILWLLLLGAVMSSLEADTRIREDAALGFRLRTMSPLTCEELSQVPDDASGPLAEFGTRPAAGASRS